MGRCHAYGTCADHHWWEMGLSWAASPTQDYPYIRVRHIMLWKELGSLVWAAQKLLQSCQQRDGAHL